jgi:carboxyl-terminal processing protease
VAGAIQDWDRGVIVGDTTFGKGSVQSVFPLDKTHHLKMTTAFYYTPSGRCINRPENSIRGSTKDEDDEDMEDDEFDEENDSAATEKEKKADTATYTTKGGRKVFGGGGIIPDTIVKQKIPNMVIRALFGKDLFFRFANFEYVRLKKRNRIAGDSIVISSGIMKDFYHFLDSLDFTYQSLSQAKFDEFKRAVDLLKDTTADTAKKRIVLPGEKPKWVGAELASLEKAVGELDTLLIRESRRAVAENEDAIKRYLSEALIIRHHGQDTDVYYRFKLDDDPQLEAAVSFVRNSDVYAALLKPAPLEKKEKAEKVKRKKAKK